jgi:hypothetical protein
MRARLMVAILSLALIYAFTCSGHCAICSGAGATAAVESHACEHSAPDAAGGAQQRGPARPDCFGHHRLGFDVMQSDGISRFQLSAMGHASPFFSGAVGADGVIVASSFLSDLAPPRFAAIFPQKNISILRI